MDSKKIPIAKLEVAIDRDIFLRNLVRELSATLEDVVGLDEASGFISIVGQHIAEWMGQEYKDALQQDRLTATQITDVLIDLKKRIQGDFYVISEDDHLITLGNRQCPFEEKVIGHPSMCMMTSNVFGTITAENLGYSKVCIHDAIANGDKECRVLVYKKRCQEADQDQGREYFQS